MAEAVWDGVTRAETVMAEAVSARAALADAARGFRWDEVLAITVEHAFRVGCGTND